MLVVGMRLANSPRRLGSANRNFSSGSGLSWLITLNVDWCAAPWYVRINDPDWFVARRTTGGYQR